MHQCQWEHPTCLLSDTTDNIEKLRYGSNKNLGQDSKCTSPLVCPSVDGEDGGHRRFQSFTWIFQFVSCEFLMDNF